MKEKVTCGSHLKIKKNKQILKEKRKFADTERERNRVRERFFIFYFFSSITSLFDIRKSDR